MKALIIDTCTDHSLVALSVDGKPWQVATLPAGSRCSQFLMPTIENLLQQYRWNVESLHYIVVAVGPGSYTGIRVGVSAAKAISFAKSIPIVALSTFEGYAAQHKEEKFLPMIDARSGGIYCFVQNEPRLIPLKDILPLLKEVKTIVSPDCATIKERLSPLCDINKYIWEENWPSAVLLSQKGYERYLSRQYTFKGDIPILYLQQTQAEAELEKKDF